MSGLSIISRAQWGARQPTKKPVGMVTPQRDIYVHHTADNGPGPGPHAEAAYMRHLQRFHQDGRGWADIGYSFVIMPSGRVYEGRGFAVVGAHTEGHNSTAHGICFAGNFQTQQPTDEAIRAAGQLIRLGVSAGFIGRPFRVAGHRDAGLTACPGTNLYRRLGEIALPPTSKEDPLSEQITQVNAPVVGIAVTPSGNGYYLVCADGGVFAFGDAVYRGRVEYRLPAGADWMPRRG